MPGPPVSIGCAVVLSPGATGAPDSGIITAVFQVTVTANGMPLATAGSLCTMINSLTGIPYPLPIGPIASTGVSIQGQPLVRMLDNVPTPPGVLTILGPPATVSVIDQAPP